MDVINTTNIQKWHTEEPLFVLVLLISVGIWALLVVSIVGIIYAAIFAIFFFVSHLIFIAHIRGNAVKLGPNQFPDLYKRVDELSQQINLKKTPDAYLMQAGGTLNALATKLFGSNMIVLYSDLIEACGENHAARDMIIGHELAHIKEGHLRWMWFIMPGLLFPFIGTALSRAREFTCDRYGSVVCNNKNGALLGLSILAAGAQKGPQVNHTELVKQSKDFNSGFLTIGKWLSTHPPLCDRVSVLAPELTSARKKNTKGAVRALAILFLVFMIPFSLSVFAFSKIIPEFQKAIAESRNTTRNLKPQNIIVEKDAVKTVHSDFQILAKFVEEVRLKTGELPSDTSLSLSEVWEIYRSGQEEPFDPFDGKSYGYQIDGENYILWSVGPDGKDNTDDDIEYYSSEN